MGTSTLNKTLDQDQPGLGQEQPSKSDPWVFRDGRREISGPRLVEELHERLKIAEGVELVDVLIQAGELEAALADAGAPSRAESAVLTDILAGKLVTGELGGQDPCQQLGRIEAPGSISVSPPEGFTYYALHPLDFSRVADRIPESRAPAAIVGIRSIGTTLSAVFAAALGARGRPVSRITVRPHGHPYARQTDFRLHERAWISKQRQDGAHFFIVDEGPGRSGSTFLSVAEALADAGVAGDAITVIGSRAFDPQGLCAADSATRWRRFRFLSTIPSINTRFENWLYIGGGDWRRYFCGAEESWPESWTEMERLKFLSPDAREFCKFEGMGPRGAEVRKRAFRLAAAGFSPAVSDAGDGFLSYQALQGRRLSALEVNRRVLERMADYCAFRAAELVSTESPGSELEDMLRFNVEQEFGRKLRMEAGELTSSRPTLVDGRMQPHEWIQTRDGTILKTDGISHGDNHFFPGPCDIRWDLAATAIEWQLEADALEFLLRRFRQLSGIDPRPRLAWYMLAYSIFRMGCSKMARSTASEKELSRLDSAYGCYRECAKRLLNGQDLAWTYILAA